MTADVFLLAEEANASVSAVCRALDVPRSTQYARRGRGQSRRAKAAVQLDVEVAAVFQESKGRYGSPRELATKPVTTYTRCGSLPCGADVAAKVAIA